jgi:hypothetical protein
MLSSVRIAAMPCWNSYRSLTFLLLVSVGTLTSCSEPSKKDTQDVKPPTTPPTPVTGRFAFQRMYIQARTWAPDAEPLRLLSFNLKEVSSEGGKCGAWQATFVSPARSKALTYTYSVVESPGNVHEGAFAGREESWSGPRGQEHPFLQQALRIDSDEAFEAAAKVSIDYLKKNPKMSVLFLLELTPRFPNPTWRVLWGETIGASDYSVFVDASTGRVLQSVR